MSYVDYIRSRIGHDEYIGVGAGVFICREGKVLLQQRRDNGCWSMHAGGLELGERVEDAARRELKEETGLQAGEMHLLGVFSGPDMRYTYPNGDRVCIVQVVYVCHDFSGEITPQENEVAHLQWFDENALPENISPPDFPAFRAFKEYVKNHSQRT